MSRISLTATAGYTASKSYVIVKHILIISSLFNSFFNIIVSISLEVSFNISSLLLEVTVVAPLIANTFILITYTLIPARYPVEKAICKLYPPVSASTSITSPVKNRFSINFDSIVEEFISFTDTPPLVT